MKYGTSPTSSMAVEGGREGGRKKGGGREKGGREGAHALEVEGIVEEQYVLVIRGTFLPHTKHTHTHFTDHQYCQSAPSLISQRVKEQLRERSTNVHEYTSCSN